MGGAPLPHAIGGLRSCGGGLRCTGGRPRPVIRGPPGGARPLPMKPGGGGPRANGPAPGARNACIIFGSSDPGDEGTPGPHAPIEGIGRSAAPALPMSGCGAWISSSSSSSSRMLRIDDTAALCMSRPPMGSGPAAGALCPPRPDGATAAAAAPKSISPSSPPSTASPPKVAWLDRLFEDRKDIKARFNPAARCGWKCGPSRLAAGQTPPLLSRERESRFYYLNPGIPFSSRRPGHGDEQRPSVAVIVSFCDGRDPSRWVQSASEHAAYQSMDGSERQQGSASRKAHFEPKHACALDALQL